MTLDPSKIFFWDVLKNGRHRHGSEVISGSGPLDGRRKEVATETRSRGPTVHVLFQGRDQPTRLEPL